MSQKNDLLDVGKIIVNVQDEINKIQNILKNLPGFPEGQVPMEVAGLHNQLESLNTRLQDHKGKVVDKAISDSSNQIQPFHHFKEPASKQLHQGLSNTDNTSLSSTMYQPRRSKSSSGFNRINKNTKIELPQYNKLYQDKFDKVQLDPEERHYEVRKSQKELPFKGRSIGKNTMDKTKVKVGRNSNKGFKPLPRHQRLNPYLDPPEIGENEMQKGLITLMNTGFIPKDVDVTPAFERGCPTLNAKKMQILDQKEYVRSFKRKTDEPKYLTYSYNTTANNTQLALVPSIKDDANKFRKSQSSTFNRENHNQNNTRSKESNFNANKNDNIGKNVRISKKNINVESQSLQVYDPVSTAHSTKNFKSLPSLFNNNESKEKISLEMTKSMEIMRSEADMFRIPKTRAEIDILGNVLKEKTETLTFKNYKVVQNQEYMDFKKSNMSKWGNIAFLIKKLEKLLVNLRNDYQAYDDRYVSSAYDMDVILVSGAELARLARDELRAPKDSEILACIRGNDNKYVYQQAAIKIQARIRAFLVSKVYKRTRQLIYFSNRIKNKWKLYKLYSLTMRQVRANYDQRLQNWKVLQNNFQANWAHIKNQQRIEIHIPSLSLNEIQRNSMEKFGYRQNIQMSRIYRCKDPNVKVIYVIPYELDEEVISYYWKIFELEDIKKEQNRVTFIRPAHSDRFPSTFSLASVLYYSDKSIKQIKRLCEGRTAYIMPGLTGNIDQKLAIKLNMPLYCGDPDKSVLYSTKSGSKRIFNIAEIPIPPSAFDIYDKIEFFTTLTRLIATNIHVNRWIFKIDNEFRGRGTAYFDTHSIKIVDELRKKRVEYTDAYIDKLYEVVVKMVPKRIQFSVSTYYNSFEDYISEFVRVGGVIEASPNSPIVGNPCFAFEIQPDGHITLTGSYDKMLHNPYVCASYMMPQNVLTDLNVSSLIQSVGETLFKREIYGHVSIDFVAFKDPNNLDAHPLFWAIDVDLHLTDPASLSTFCNFILDGDLDENGYKYEIKKEIVKIDEIDYENRSILYVPYIFNRGLTYIQYKTFFHMCRLENLSYDLEMKQGTIFMLSDALQGGCLGVLGIGKSQKEALKFACTAFNFIETQTSTKKENFEIMDRDDRLNLKEIISTMKLLFRRQKK